MPLDFLNESEQVELPTYAFSYDIHFALDYFEAYLADIEKFLDQESLAIERRYRGMEEFSRFEDYWEALKIFFPDVLRRSFFMAVFAVTEARLNEICESLRESRKLTLSFRDIKADDQSIKRARKYLEKVAGITFPATKEWKALLDYKDIRDRITHNYLSSQDAFATGFCAETIKTIRTFFQQLDGALHS